VSAHDPKAPRARGATITSGHDRRYDESVCSHTSAPGRETAIDRDL